MLICVGMGNYKSPYTRCFHFSANGFILFASALFSAAICVLDYLRERQRSPSLVRSSFIHPLSVCINSCSEINVGTVSVQPKKAIL